MSKAKPQWLTRRQVAELLGTSELEVKAMEGRDLWPVKRADRSWCFAPRDVAAYMGGKNVITTRVFRAFRDENKTLVDVAIDTHLPARLIRDLRVDYDELAGSFTLEKTSVEALRSLLGDDAVKDGTALLHAVRALADASVATSAPPRVPPPRIAPHRPATLAAPAALAAPAPAATSAQRQEPIPAGDHGGAALGDMVALAEKLLRRKR